MVYFSLRRSKRRILTPSSIAKSVKSLWKEANFINHVSVQESVMNDTCSQNQRKEKPRKNDFKSGGKSVCCQGDCHWE